MLVVNAAVLTIWAHGNPKNHPKIVVFNRETNGSGVPHGSPFQTHLRCACFSFCTFCPDSVHHLQPQLRAHSSIDKEPMKPSALLLDPSSSPTPTILQETMLGVEDPTGQLGRSQRSRNQTNLKYSVTIYEM